MNRRPFKMKLTSRGWITWLGLCLILTQSIACEVDMSIKVDEKNPPSFSLSGSGNMISFMVMEVPPENQKQTVQRSSDVNRLLWEVRPAGGENVIRKLPEITYGKIPAGFDQYFPKDGNSPEPLREGKIYEVSGTAYNANGGLIWITVQGGKTVRVPVPGAN